MSSPTLPLSPNAPTTPLLTSTPDTPKRKPRPSPIHVPASPNTQTGNLPQPPATTTGIIWRRKPSFALPSITQATPVSAGLDAQKGQHEPAGVIGEHRSGSGNPGRRSSTGREWLPAPKSAAANFAQTRGIQSVTVRTVVSPPASAGQFGALSARSSGGNESEEGGLGSPMIIKNVQGGDKERGLKSAGAGGLRSSRTVEVDFLRNEMERAIRANGVDLGRAEVGENEEVVRNDIVLCKFYHTPGLTCTSRPCRFIHEFSPSITPSSATFPTTTSLDPSATNNTESSVTTGPPVEIVEIYPMSGGGKGAGSKWSKAKYRTVDCRDWEEKGECGYGEFCSFVHRDKNEVKVKVGDEDKVDDKAGDEAGETKKVEVTEVQDDKQTERPSSTRPKSFNGSPIVVPDLRWTQDDGLTVSNPATGTKPDFRHVANKLVETISSATAGSATLQVGIPSQVKVSTPITPAAAQYASVPPRSAWVMGPPRMLGVESAKQGVSPDLPISAYTFSTDSPGTPYHGIEGEVDSDLPEEAVEHVKQDDDRARVQIVGPEQMGGYSPYENPHLVLPSYLQPIHDSGAYPWPIERLYPQAMQATWDAILKNPKEQQDTDIEEATRRLVAMKLARMVKGGDLPPQEVQSKMNYRTKPCKFYANGDCPRGDGCSYLHDSSNKGIPAPEPLSDKVVKKLACKFFNTSEGCKAGDECPFLHVRVVPFGAPLMLRPRPWRTRPCRHFQTGTCVAGDQCHFAHYLGDKPVKEQKKCAFFSTEAGCKLGEECKFAHVPEVVVEQEATAVLA